MPDQFHEDVERLLPVIRQALAQVAEERQEAADEREHRQRFRRRLFPILVILGFLVTGGYLYREREERCDRITDARAASRHGIAGALAEIYDYTDGAVTAEEALVIDRVEARLLRDLPPPEC